MQAISQQLANLSARAKSVEEASAAALNEARETLLARREATRADVTAAIDKVGHDIKSAEDTVSGGWESLKAKVAGDADAFKANVARWKHERDVKRAENRADSLESEAVVAVDYAIAAVEQAKLAVLDAVVGRVEAKAEEEASS